MQVIHTHSHHQLHNARTPLLFPTGSQATAKWLDVLSHPHPNREVTPFYPSISAGAAESLSNTRRSRLIDMQGLNMHVRVGLSETFLARGLRSEPSNPDYTWGLLLYKPLPQHTACVRMCIGNIAIVYRNSILNDDPIRQCNNASYL